MRFSLEKKVALRERKCSHALHGLNKSFLADMEGESGFLLLRLRTANLAGPEHGTAPAHRVKL